MWKLRVILEVAKFVAHYWHLLNNSFWIFLSSKCKACEGWSFYTATEWKQRVNSVVLHLSDKWYGTRKVLNSYKHIRDQREI